MNGLFQRLTIVWLLEVILLGLWLIVARFFELPTLDYAGGAILIVCIGFLMGFVEILITRE